MADKRTYADRREELIRAVAKRRRKVKTLAITHKGGKCEVCGYNKYQGALDLHHRNPKEKSRCRVCRPTNQPLFFGNFSQDMQIRSPCEPYEAESIEAKEVDIDGQLYYYTIDNKKIGVERAASLRVFEKDTQSEGYVELKNTHIIYKKILASLV